MADTMLYLHGLVAPAIEESPAASAAAALTGVFLVATEGVACAVSAVDPGDYDRAAGGGHQPAQIEWLAAQVRRHHDVLLALHAAGTVVPFKFGAICPGLEQLRSLLREYRQPAAEMLAQFEGKDEWSLKAAVDEDALSSCFERSRPDLIALKREHERLPEGRAHFARKQLARATAALVAASVATVEESVMERLSELDIVITGSLPHAALLVERHRFAEMERSLADLEREHAAVGLAIALTGPWPPYSFTTDLTGGRS
jgi:hypothetical protein